MANNRIVAPLSARQVETIAERTRLDLGLDLDGRVSMTPILEQVLYDLIDDYSFEVEEDRAMGENEGLTDTVKPIIKMKHSVYAALQRGEPRPRMTAAHEFGHLLLHCGHPTYLPFATGYDPLYDPERQANIFAAAFLMPQEAFRRCRTAREAQRTFGVSLDAALKRARHIGHKFAAPRPILTVLKKKGHGMRRTP